MAGEEWTIRQLAQKTGVSTKTLRYWEAIGLISKPRRTHTNYRIYSSTDIDRVIFILKAKSLGFTLSEIKKIFEVCREKGQPCGDVIEWASLKIRLLEEQIRTLQRLKARLTCYLKTWQSLPACPPMSPREICRCIEDVPLPGPAISSSQRR